MTSTTDEALLRAAAGARASAYAPYSDFRVGAAVLTSDGRLFAGCNVENASYGLTVCAERSAVFAAVAGGAREVSTVAIVVEAALPVPPCGACLQVLAEFGDDLRVVSKAGGRVEVWTLGDLLPRRFEGTSVRRPRT